MTRANPDHRYGLGTLNYSLESDGHKVIVEVDPGIVDLTRALLPKALRLNKQKYPPHITVLRKEDKVIGALWNAYHGMEVEFVYDAAAFCNTKYTWLRVWCPLLNRLRVELGLSESGRLSRPPDGEYCFHITIGNFKEVRG